MSAVTLPSLSWLATVKPRLGSFNAVLQPTLGGPVQKISRLGSRYAVDVSMPRLDGATARAWLAAMMKAEAGGNTVIMAWPKPPPASGLGTPLVNGAGQAGTSLIVDGLTASVTVKAGSFFSLTVAARNYLYSVTADTAANGSGQATLPIAPMLRASPADNAALAFTAPQIEGFISGNTVDWDMDVLTSYGLSFTLAEIE